MIDLHCHLLPGVDDGARTMEDALTLAEAAVANGVKASVLTPHVYPGVFDNRLSTLRPVYGNTVMRSRVPVLRWMCIWVARCICTRMPSSCWRPTTCR